MDISRRLRFPAVLRLLALAVALLAVALLAVVPAHAACPALLQHTAARLQDDKPVDLCQYQGKVLLVVNTASFCGFTPQFKGLEQLQQAYGPRGLVVLGFPSNDFHQEMADRAKIAEFCEGTYGVRFPMFAPSHVTMPDANPLYRQLIQLTGKQPMWNFYKYLIDRQGRVVDVYSSLTSPDSTTLQAQLERLLAAPSIPEAEEHR